ncbi:MAG: hypothetical protein JWR38_5204 [Mucilaginibacter sp.]|nr:hypothetical protein [Mucilaginibacter sp.]
MKTPIYIVLLLVIFLAYKSHAADRGKFAQGYYLDSTQHKIEGLICFDGTDCESFLFKKDLGEKAVKINVNQCSKFGIGEHQYETISQIDFVTIIRKRHISKAFAELLESGNVKLYKIGLALSSMDAAHKVTTTVTELSDNTAGGNMSGYLRKARVYYYVRRDGEDKYTRVESRKSKFKAQMEDYLKDKPEIVALLKNNKNYNFNNIEVIIHSYNRGLPENK